VYLIKEKYIDNLNIDSLFVRSSNFEYTGFQFNFTIYISCKKITSKQTRIAYYTNVNFRAFVHDINQKFNWKPCIVQF